MADARRTRVNIETESAQNRKSVNTCSVIYTYIHQGVPARAGLGATGTGAGAAVTVAILIVSYVQDPRRTRGAAGQPAHSEASDAEGRTVTDTKIQNAYDKQRPSILRAGLSILCDFLLAFGLAVNPNRMR